MPVCDAPKADGLRVSRGLIAAAIRSRIVSGRLSPGARLPTRTEIEKEFDASPITVQHSIDVLRREGFAEPRGWGGTFVALHPPHLYHYAMVMTRSPAKHGWTRFFQALANEAARYDGSAQDPRRISLHTGVEDHPDNHEMRGLLTAVRNHCVAGLILPEHPAVTGLAFTALAREGAVPQVAFLREPQEGVSAVSFEPFEDLALDYLASCKCHRVAVISNPRTPSHWDAVVKAITARGMTTQPYWIQMVDLNSPACAQNVAHLLFSGKPEERPDALFITDDNLVEYCIAGIVQARVRVPDELHVAAHCNFPWSVPRVIPVKRLGYDARRVLAACLESLEEQRLTQRPVHRIVRAVFEEV